MENLLEKLNAEQRLAAETTEGPVLILAGAGAGKTRAVTFRMANLIAKGTPADAILAGTVPNKAAEGMQTRGSDLLLRAGGPPERPVVLAVPLPGPPVLTPRNVLSKISYAKNHAQAPEQMRAEAFGPDTRKVADIYAGYETLLKQSKAVDFDDLLLRSARLLRDVPEVRDRWRKRFAYLHVDEYQDTNRVQYELLRMLTNEQKNVCVVGDEDQSIYRWRGADVSILLSFSQDFPAARVIRLEGNYRSTQKILEAAGGARGDHPSSAAGNRGGR